MDDGQLNLYDDADGDGAETDAVQSSFLVQGPSGENQQMRSATHPADPAPTPVPLTPTPPLDVLLMTDTAYYRAVCELFTWRFDPKLGNTRVWKVINFFKKLENVEMSPGAVAGFLFWWRKRYRGEAGPLTLPGEKKMPEYFELYGLDVGFQRYVERGNERLIELMGWDKQGELLPKEMVEAELNKIVQGLLGKSESGE